MSRKNDKILIIVEGKSDKIFIEGLLKHLKLIRKFDIKLSGSKNKCEILNNKTINNLVKDAKDDGYKRVYILIDLVTDCGSFKPTCFVSLKNWYYKNKLNRRFHNYVDVIVVVNELECWELLGWINNNGNYSVNNCKNDIIRKLNSKKKKSKTKIAQYSIKKIDKIIENKNLNQSFEYFLNKL